MSIHTASGPAASETNLNRSRSNSNSSSSSLTSSSSFNPHDIPPASPTSEERRPSALGIRDIQKLYRADKKGKAREMERAATLPINVHHIAGSSGDDLLSPVGGRAGEVFAADVLVRGWRIVGGSKWSGDAKVGAYVVYDIEITKRSGGEIEIMRRYTDFVRLRSALKIKFPRHTDITREESHVYDYVILSPSRSLTSAAKFSEKLLEDRRPRLQRFLRTVMLHPEMGKGGVGSVVGEWVLSDDDVIGTWTQFASAKCSPPCICFTASTCSLQVLSRTDQAPHQSRTKQPAKIKSILISRTLACHPYHEHRYPVDSGIAEWAQRCRLHAPSVNEEEQVWGNAKRGVVRSQISFPGQNGEPIHHESYTFKRSPGEKGWRAGSVSIMNIIRDKSRNPRLLFVGQFRHAIQMPTLELPGGKIDAGEDTITAAARENNEETGLPNVTKNGDESDGFKLVSSKVFEMPFHTDPGIGGSGSQLVVFKWQTDKTISTAEDLPEIRNLEPSEIACSLTRFVPSLHDLPAFLDECEAVGVVLNSQLALVRPIIELLSISATTAGAESAEH